MPKLLSERSSPRIFSEILAALEKAVMHAEISPGQRLLESDLAQKFGVSRGPVREVLQELEMRGVVRREANRGTFLVDITQQEISDHYLFRYHFEPMTAGLAADRRSYEDTIEIQQASFIMEKHFEQGDIHRFLDADADFHYSVVKATHSPLLVSLSETARWRTRLLMALDKGTQGTAPDFQSTLESHKSICSSIIEQDAEGAGLAMKEHVITIARRLRLLWAEAPGE